MEELFENILERLQEERELSYADFRRYVDEVSPCLDAEYDDFFHRGLERASRLVKEVAEEYKDGWIACSEMLPEIGQEVIVATKNGSVYSNIYYDYIDSNTKEPCFHRWDDEMWNCFMLDVIAWQPLPKPFKERD